jgi:hypothetical protein
MYQLLFDESGVRKVGLTSDSKSAAIAKRRVEFLNLIEPLVMTFDHFIKTVAAEYRERRPDTPSEEELLRQEKDRLAFLWVDFIREHTGDFFDCEANRSLLEQSTTQRGEAITAETLELAFMLEQKNLAPKPRNLPTA